jgi:hypothetical protein
MVGNLARRKHGTAAGYLGLGLSVIALTGGTALGASMIDGTSVKPGTVRTRALGKSSVTSAKIHMAAVTSVKLAQSAVVSRTLHRGSVTADKLAANAVTSASIAPGTLQMSDLSPALASAMSAIGGTGAAGPPGSAGAPGSPGAAGVSSSVINDGAVTTSKLADGAITDTKLAAGSISSASLQDGAVTGSKLGLQVVTADATITPLSRATKIALCPAGTVALSGGVAIDDLLISGATSEIRATQPVLVSGVPTGWSGTVVDLSTTASFPYHVYAICD